jgi:hypothetical protein
MIAACALIAGGVVVTALPSAAASTNTIEDTFQRANQTGWGTTTNADGVTNVAWKGNADGTHAYDTIAGNTGQMAYDGTPNTPNLARNSTPNNGGDGLAELSFSATGHQAAYVAMNFCADLSCGYEARIDTIAGNLGLARRSGGSTTIEASTAFTPAAAQKYWVRFNVNAGTLKMREWKDGTTEPAAWKLTWTDGSPLASNYAGLGSSQNQNTSATVNVSYFAWSSNPAVPAQPPGGSGSGAPVVTTTAATGVTSAAATLNGTVNPESQVTTYQFEYGTTTAYGTTVPVPAGSAGSGTAAVAESANITGLTANTTYHFRLDATNGSGTASGADQQFTTSAGGLGGFKFVGSIDTMKLSKDQASGGFTAGDAQAVDLIAQTSATHITDDVPIEAAATLVAWASRIHADGKKVWFRLSSTNGGTLAHGDSSASANFQPPYDGAPNFAQGYLTSLHNLMINNSGLFQPGDILDGDAEVENSLWWANNYGCGVQQGCTPCPALGSMTSANVPCSPVSEMNNFLQVMTSQENSDLATLGLIGCATLASANCVVTQVHSTDPGTATNQLSKATVQAMGNLITVDAYPDQNTTDPATAANAWVSQLQSLRNSWASQGVNVSILVGEWGYSNAINVSDATQQNVIAAEVTQAFPTIPYLLGTNYWVGPGAAGDGGYTQIMQQSNGTWMNRPAVSNVSDFYATMNQ